jgi:hypothetical protein
MASIFKGPYLALVACLLVVSSNIGLINREMSLQDGGGHNLLGLRDVLMVPTIFYGLFMSCRYRIFGNPLATVAVALLCLTPIVACVGILFDASPYNVLSDGVTMAGWSLALILGRYLQNTQRLTTMIRIMVGLGIAVSLGVLVEGASGGTIAVVTPATTALLETVRSTPTGWPMMMMACSFLMVSILQGPSNRNVATLGRLGCLGVIVVASLLTQSRTLLVGIVGSTIIYLTLCAVLASTRTKWHYVLGVAILAVTTLPVVYLLGQSWIRDDFTEVFVNRYSVLYSTDAAEGHLQDEGRMDEMKVIFGECFLQSPLVGFGLAAPYMPDPDYTLVHCSFGFFFLRYGLLGLLLWLVFIGLVVRSTAHFVHVGGPWREWGQALSLAMLNMVICATFGNQFTVPYGVQQTMIGLGALIACQQLDKQYRCAAGPSATSTCELYSGKTS